MSNVTKIMTGAEVTAMSVSPMPTVNTMMTALINKTAREIRLKTVLPSVPKTPLTLEPNNVSSPLLRRALKHSTATPRSPPNRSTSTEPAVLVPKMDTTI